MTYFEAETPIFFPPDGKSWLIWTVLILGKIEGRRRREWQKMRCLDGVTNSMDMSLSNSQSWWWTRRPGMLQSMGPQRVRHDWESELTWTLFKSRANDYTTKQLIFLNKSFPANPVILRCVLGEWVCKTFLLLGTSWKKKNQFEVINVKTRHESHFKTAFILGKCFLLSHHLVKYLLISWLCGDSESACNAGYVSSIPQSGKTH